MAGGRAREWVVVALVSSAILFAQSVVFAGQGLALFAAGRELSLSPGALGMAFTCVVIGACVGAPLPIPLCRLIGGRGTLTMGLVTIALAFGILARAHGLGPLHAAMVLAGIGFSLSGNTPGVYLISGWSGPRAGSMIGLYMMAGMFANAVGPPVVQAVIAALDWRGYATATSFTALAVAAACAVGLREPAQSGPASGAEADRLGLMALLRSPLFVLLAAATVATQTCMVTVASVIPAHLASRGFSAETAARMLAVEGLAATAISGVSGFVSRFLPPWRLFTLSLLSAGGGMVLLALAPGLGGLICFAMLLGFGIGGATLSVTLLLVEAFGARGGSACLGAIWTLAGLAAFGPWLAGVLAQSQGGYALVLALLGVAQWPLAFVAMRWRQAPQQV